MEVLRADGDEAVMIIGLFLFLVGIILVVQSTRAPSEVQKGSRQTAAAIFIMASVAVLCFVVGKGIGRANLCPAR